MSSKAQYKYYTYNEKKSVSKTMVYENTIPKLFFLDIQPINFLLRRKIKKSCHHHHLIFSF